MLTGLFYFMGSARVSIEYSSSSMGCAHAHAHADGQPTEESTNCGSVGDPARVTGSAPLEAVERQSVYQGKISLGKSASIVDAFYPQGLPQW